MRPPFTPKSAMNPALAKRLTQLLKEALDSQAKGDNERAKVCFEQVTKIQPNNFECWHILAVFEYQNKNYSKARQLFLKVISLNPRYAPAHSNLGLVLQDTGEFEQAIECFNAALKIDPELSAAYNNRGIALKDLGRLEEARQSYAVALVVLPDYPQALYNMAEILKALRRWNESLTYYNRTVHSHKQYAEAYNNRGLMLQFLNQVDAAIHSFDQTIAIQPNYAPAHSNKSLALLLKGDYEQGWAEHEWRWKMAEFTSAQRNFKQVQWTGQIAPGGDQLKPLKGARVLVHCEQGLGDTLQFCRYIPKLLQTGAEVFFEVQPTLFNLMTQILPKTHLIKHGETLPAFDFHSPLISLPYALRNAVTEIPSEARYLRTEREVLERWRARLGDKGRPRIGWVWSGNAFHHNDAFRSLPLNTLIPYLINFSDQYDCYGLQIELRSAEADLLAQVPRWQQFSSSIKSFDDTAALCELMDVVVSVDTSVAHLCGALGKPTCLLLPFSPDWRWLLDRRDTPWYPSLKLFRQQRIDGWEDVLSELQKDMQKILTESTADV